MVETAKERNIPIRVGVNSGSLEKELVEKYHGVTAEGLVESALDKVHIIEELGYDNLVIHGPFNATVLAGLAQDVAGKRLKRFRYRGLQPSLLGNELSANAAQSDTGLVLWIGLPGGAVSMRAEADF